MSVSAAEKIIAARNAENPLAILASTITRPPQEAKNPFEKTILLADGLLKAPKPQYGAREIGIA